MNASVQLIINGAVIANNMVLHRTYGNSMGIASNGANGRYWLPSVVGSDTPAEIINYDSSLMLWGEAMAGAAESDTYTVTYQHELAPRY
jgi:hypothetical protein